MLEKELNEVYTKFKLNFYQSMFGAFEDREASLTTIETFCIEAIYSLDRPTINEVVRFTGMSQPNVAYKVANLEKKGYLRKIQSKQDKREYILEVTDKFDAYYGINFTYLKLVADRINQRFPEEDVKKLKNMLAIISEELMPEVTEKISRPPKFNP